MSSALQLYDDLINRTSILSVTGPQSKVNPLLETNYNNSFSPYTMASSLNLTKAVATSDVQAINAYDPFMDKTKVSYSGVKNVKQSAVSASLPDGKMDPTSAWVARNKDSIIGFSNSVGSALEGIAKLRNGYIEQLNYYSKASSSDYVSEQYDRAASLLLDNQKNITRAAQMDANVYKLQGAQTKSEQKIAQAASGFAVGKGVNRVTLNTTDARTNYNVAAMMLRSELQNAESTRQAGTYAAQAEIQRGEAEAYRIMGKAAKSIATLGAINSFIKSGTSFYLGLSSAGAFGSVTADDSKVSV